MASRVQELKVRSGVPLSAIAEGSGRKVRSQGPDSLESRIVEVVKRLLPYIIKSFNG